MADWAVEKTNVFNSVIAEATGRLHPAESHQRSDTEIHPSMGTVTSNTHQWECKSTAQMKTSCENYPQRGGCSNKPQRKPNARVCCFDYAGLSESCTTSRCLSDFQWREESGYKVSVELKNSGLKQVNALQCKTFRWDHSWGNTL